MANRPFGRQKNVTGQGKKVGRRGEGLGTGPVGSAGGYQDRPHTGSAGRRDDTFFGDSGSASSGSGTTRGFGGKGLIAIIIAAVLLLGGGGGLSGLFGNLFGGGSSASSTPFSLPDLSSLSGIGGLFGSGGSTESAKWTAEKNTGKLNERVSSAARAKRTVIHGNGNDKVTIMVYLCGTDLESKHGMATNDLQEMCSASLNSKINLLVYTGGCKEWKNRTISSSKNQIYKIENGKLTFLKDDGSASMTSPSTLTGFIKYCTQNYPANRNMLIFWDHGGGSLSGYGYDEKNSKNGSMTLSGINEALKNANTTFDMIGFDTCLMATAENALMLTEYADYMVASEETEPGIGWYYTNWLTELAKNPGMPTLNVGQKIVDDFVDKCGTQCAGQKATLSVIDLAELEATAPQKLKDFATATSELIRSDGYQAVSDARSSTKEFSSSSKIDQVDLIHLAYNMNTAEGKELAKTLLSAVKYNRTSSNVSNAYGLSIYFPYQRTSKVDSAVATYKAIGMDSEYTRCIQEFASLEVAGQAASGGAGNPLGSLLGSGSSGGGLDIGSVLGGLMGGSNLFGVSGLTSGNSGFLGKGLSMDSEEYLASHRFDASALVWTEKNGQTQMILSEEQWALVHDLQLNVFLDDGEGFIDLGMDCVFELTEDSALLGEYDGTWLAIDDQPVAFYYEGVDIDGTNYTYTGRVPVLINGTRANLIIVFDSSNPYGYIAGARFDYVNGETETVAKGLTALSEGDRLDFLCDYYTYDGSYADSYMFGEPMTYYDGMQISNVYLDADDCQACYCFTDIYNQQYWTPVLPE